MKTRDEQLLGPGVDALEGALEMVWAVVGAALLVGGVLIEHRQWQRARMKRQLEVLDGVAGEREASGGSRC